MKDHLKTQCFGLKSLLTPEGCLEKLIFLWDLPPLWHCCHCYGNACGYYHGDGKKGQSVVTQLPPDWSSSGFAFLPEIYLQGYREFHMLDNGILSP